MTLREIRSLIRAVPDFPQPGIVFRDITPLLAHPEGFNATIERLAEQADGAGPDAILAIESRGFIFGAALANRLALPLQIVRKSGKLPRESIAIRYELEYGHDHLEVHSDAIEPGGRYLIVDDLIATGGTAEATARLVRQQQGIVAKCLFVVELSALNGRKALGDLPVVSLISF